MTCGICHKGSRAFLYCRKLNCPGPLMAVSSSSIPPEHAKFNELLDQAIKQLPWMRQIADTAYAIAQTENLGPRNDLLRIADAARNFSGMVARTRPL